MPVLFDEALVPVKCLASYMCESRVHRSLTKKFLASGSLLSRQLWLPFVSVYTNTIPAG